MAEGAVLWKLPLDILLRRDKAVSPSKNLLRLEEANSSLTAARGGGRKFRRTKRERIEAATRRHAIGLGFCLGTLLFNTSLQFPAIVSAEAERCLLPAAGESLFPAERKMPSTGVAYACRYHTPLRYFFTASALRHSPFSAGASSHRYPSDPRPSAGIRRFLSMERFWSKDVHKNKALVEHLQQYGVIKSSKVAEVMDTIDRGLFVPDGAAAYVDNPMQIGYNATISAPHMHAMCLELLEGHLQPGMHALDIGSGTGYLTACFALMVGPEGRAVGVEHIPELVATSMENIKRSAAAPLLKDGSLFIHVGDGRLGWQEFAPYDAIHVGAAAPQIPQPLIDQLKPGGRMVIPVGTLFQDLKVVDKKPDGSISVRTETSVRYVPLTSRESQLRD